MLKKKMNASYQASLVIRHIRRFTGFVLCVNCGADDDVLVETRSPCIVPSDKVFSNICATVSHLPISAPCPLSAVLLLSCPRCPIRLWPVATSSPLLIIPHLLSSRLSSFACSLPPGRPSHLDSIYLCPPPTPSTSPPPLPLLPAVSLGPSVENWPARHSYGRRCVKAVAVRHRKPTHIRTHTHTYTYRQTDTQTDGSASRLSPSPAEATS